jgi:hypothetical protein
MAEKDQFSEREREQLATLGIRPVSPLAVRLWAAGGAILAFDLIFPLAHTFWMRWANRYSTNLDPLKCIEILVNSDSAVSTSAAWVTLQWICIGLIRFNRHEPQGGELLIVALIPALTFVLLSIVGGTLMTRFRFTTRTPKSRLRNDFIKSGQWWGGLFLVSLALVLVWCLSIYQVSFWSSWLESGYAPGGLSYVFQERVRRYLRTSGLLLFGGGVVLGGLGQIRFILRYRGRVEHLLRLSHD